MDTRPGNPGVRLSGHGLNFWAKPFQGFYAADHSVTDGVKAFEKHRIRPMYAGANMGHPSREHGLVVAREFFFATCKAPAVRFFQPVQQQKLLCKKAYLSG
jgi:hypothetical protein